MTTSQKRLFILGATGFIGSRVSVVALQQGWKVTAVARDLEAARELERAGVQILRGDASTPSEWIAAVAGSDVLIDLLQPKLPSRIGVKQIQQVANERLTITKRLLEALLTTPREQRPRYFSVSGLDDLMPDRDGGVHESSDTRNELRGFAYIGVPVRKLIESAKISSIFIYLGIVYGPGKAFADTIFPKLAAGQLKYPGNGRNRVPLVHVDDAARALVHLAELPATKLTAKSVIVAAGDHATMTEFLGFAARWMGVKEHSRFPLWLARLALGKVMCDALVRDITVQSDTLLRTGFQFTYPSFREGLPATLAQLGYKPHASRAATPTRDTATIYDC